MTITGTNFASGATVTFGGTAATNVVVVNSTTITATTPAGNAGGATVTVTVPDGQSWEPGQWVHLQRGSSDRFQPGGGSHAAVPDGDGAAELSRGTDAGRLECRGGGVERHHLDGAVGDGQCGEQLQSGDRTDEWDGVAAIDLLRARTLRAGATR